MQGWPEHHAFMHESNYAAGRLVSMVIRSKRYANEWAHDGKYLANRHYYFNGGTIMFNWAIIFLVIALIAAALGFTGIAGAATNIAWILFVIGIILFVVFFFVGRGRGSAKRGP